MVAKSKAVMKAPSAKIAKERKAVKQTQRAAVAQQREAESALRKAGGYGKKVVSIWDIPPGGIKNSPAYKKVLSRCGGGKTLPPAETRAGAPLQGGYPLTEYPPNVLVDAQRVYWLPDNWAQVYKNTGPGGTYLGWMSPEGKFFYHRSGYPSAIEESLGRKLSAKDGINGILRFVRTVVKPDADKKFLQECLTAAERKHVVPASQFHFGVVSARRATSDTGIADLMLVQGHFINCGVTPTWYVDEASLEDYKKLGLNAKVGGKLTPARNMALVDANKAGKRCVQVSDDIGKWEFLNIAKQDLRGEKTFDKANAALAGTERHVISPLAAAQFILAKMRSSPLKPQLGGVFPTNNAALTMGCDPYSTDNFILGDFFVVDSSPCRFDTSMTLKEDYDFTCSHLQRHGSILRCNRMFVHAKHATNSGGAVAVRDDSGSKERLNIAILQKKWPGVFMLNKKRKDEVLMHWKNLGNEQDVEAAPKKGLAVKKVSLKSATKKFAQVAQAAFPGSAMLRFTGKEAKEAYITARCKKNDKCTVEQCLGRPYTDASGASRTYGVADLKYDIHAGRLEIMKGKK